MPKWDGKGEYIVQHLLPRLGEHWNAKDGRHEGKFWSPFNMWVPKLPEDYEPVITAQSAAESVENEGSMVERTTALKFADAVHNLVHSTFGKYAPGNPVRPSDRPWVAMGKPRPPEITS